MRGLVAPLALLLVTQASQGAEKWRVVGVTDGDSITCLTPDKRQKKVRLNAIDAPERGQPFANKSRQALSDMVFDKEVEVEIIGEDKYDRTIGRVTVDGRDVNEEMVARGMAWQYVKYDQSRALREAELGFWALVVVAGVSMAAGLAR